MVHRRDRLQPFIDGYQPTRRYIVDFVTVDEHLDTGEGGCTSLLEGRATD